jgi:hypothetical protein
MFNPMKGCVAETNSGGLPAGNYVGLFECAEYLPVQEPDEMTGKGGRQWAKIAFKWRIAEGEHKDKTAIRETPESNGIKSQFIQWCGLVMSKSLTPKDGYDLAPFVGRKYLITVSVKADKNGNPTAWTHVSNAMLMP